MLTFIAIMVVAIFLLGLYGLVALNGGFIRTNRNTDSLLEQCKVIVVTGDKVMGKYNQMTRDIIEDVKG